MDFTFICFQIYRVSVFIKEIPRDLVAFWSKYPNSFSNSRGIELSTVKRLKTNSTFIIFVYKLFGVSFLIMSNLVQIFNFAAKWTFPRYLLKKKAE